MTSFQNENAAVQNQNANVPNMVSVNRTVQNQNIPVDNENSKTTVVKNENSKTLDCNDPDGYSLVIVEDPNRNIEETVTVPKFLNIVVGDDVMAAIKIPTQSDANGFSLRSSKKTTEGFEIAISYGSRYYYRKQFNFICKEGSFYLYKVGVESFDKNDPGSMDKPDEKEIQIKPNLPIERFSLFDYLVK